MSDKNTDYLEEMRTGQGNAQIQTYNWPRTDSNDLNIDRSYFEALRLHVIDAEQRSRCFGLKTVVFRTGTN